jgi:hypothetical protein
MSGPTGSAGPLCPQACRWNGQGKLRADRATQVISICPSWGVSSLTWAPLRRGFLLPESGPVACAWIRRGPGFAPSGGLARARRRVIRLTGSQSRLFAVRAFPSASRAARLLSWSRRSTRQRAAIDDMRPKITIATAGQGCPGVRCASRSEPLQGRRPAVADPPHRMTNAPSGPRTGVRLAKRARRIEPMEN